MDKSDLFGYGVTIRQLAADDGGGWVAQIQEIDGCIADGETVDEALDAVKDMLALWLVSARENHKTVPPPTKYQEPVQSGKFTVRVPKTLHRHLVEAAEREGVSLNQLVNNLLALNLGARQINKKEMHYHFYTIDPREDWPLWLDRLELGWLDSDTQRVHEAPFENGYSLSIDNEHRR